MRVYCRHCDEEIRCLGVKWFTKPRLSGEWGTYCPTSPTTEHQPKEER